MINSLSELLTANDVELWKLYAAKFAQFCGSDAEVRKVLAVDLVQTIPALVSETVSELAAQTWLELWKDSTNQYKEFEIPISLLNAAVRYKETKGDRRVLMALPRELRDLLQPLVASQKPKN